jgi:PhzF family phenazine biosynthesis protein
MRYRFLICDVFTNQRFGGNQLAVLPEASGLSDAQMQQIAREFNFSESTFVFPSTTGGTRQVRIFTPVAELPFAGHPNVGTAFALATIGALGELGAATTVTFDEKAGRVPVQIHRQDTGFRCVLTAPEALSIGKAIDATLVAAAVSVSPSDIVTVTHQPQVASVGLPFVFAEVRDRAVLGRMKVNVSGFEAIGAQGVPPNACCWPKPTSAVAASWPRESAATASWSVTVTLLWRPGNHDHDVIHGGPCRNGYSRDVFLGDGDAGDLPPVGEAGQPDRTLAKQPLEDEPAFVGDVGAIAPILINVLAVVHEHGRHLNQAPQRRAIVGDDLAGDRPGGYQADDEIGDVRNQVDRG